MEPEPKYSVGDRVSPVADPAVIGTAIGAEMETRPGCEGRWFYRVKWPIVHADSDGWYAEGCLVPAPADLSGREGFDQPDQITELRRRVKLLGKQYGRASRTIGELRRELSLARLHRVCWAKRSASDCAACRSVFGPESTDEWLGDGLRRPPLAREEREARAAADISAFYGGEPTPMPEGVAAIHCEPAFYEKIRAITAWLDQANPDSEHEDAMRVLKLAEECGEAAEAYIGMVGQNPRKGVTHTRDDLLAELADVAVTALCAIQHFTRDIDGTRDAVDTKLASIMRRAGLLEQGRGDAGGQ